MTTKAQHLESTVRNHLDQIVFGMERIIHGVCVALIAGGHVLLQGPPGLGKTLLAKSLAAKLGGTFKRIQGTTDLMPSDITGLHVYDRERNTFEFVPGPLFADVVLVDEINRIGPKTQSALLQAMEESQISIDRHTYPLPDEFFVIATQNPHEFEGTFPLPEAQLDRFLLRLELTYPEPVMEQQVMRTYDLPRGRPTKAVASDAQLPKSSLADARGEVEGVHVSECMYRYVAEIAGATRAHQNVSLGASTRGALGVMRCARIEACLRGGEFVTPDDVKAVAQSVLAHRLVLTADALLEGIQASQVVDDILGQVPVPRE